MLLLTMASLEAAGVSWSSSAQAAAAHGVRAAAAGATPHVEALCSLALPAAMRVLGAACADAIAPGGPGFGACDRLLMASLPEWMCGTGVDSNGDSSAHLALTEGTGEG